MPAKRLRERRRKATLFDKADASLLVKHDFHPIEDMIITAKSLEGAERGALADKIAKYFYPTLRALEVKPDIDSNITIVLGGTDS